MALRPRLSPGVPLSHCLCWTGLSYRPETSPSRGLRVAYPLGRSAPSPCKGGRSVAARTDCATGCDTVSAQPCRIRNTFFANPTRRMARWLRWAQAYADLIDPLAEVQGLPRDPEGHGAKPLDLHSFGLDQANTEESPAVNPGGNTDVNGRTTRSVRLKSQASRGTIPKVLPVQNIEQNTGRNTGKNTGRARQYA